MRKQRDLRADFRDTQSEQTTLWCYLASVLDLHSKKIVGYSFSKKMTTNMVMRTLESAYVTQKPPKGLILHTDLGTQYTSSAFAEQIQRYGMIQSFSKKACPYDNACIESFHYLKKEELHHQHYQNYEKARAALFEFIEGGITENVYMGV